MWFKCSNGWRLLATVAALLHLAVLMEGTSPHSKPLTYSSTISGHERNLMLTRFKEWAAGNSSPRTSRVEERPGGNSDEFKQPPPDLHAGLLSEEWEHWIVKHDKRYKDTSEVARRRSVWMTNRELIEQHNKELALLLGYRLRMNQFGDLTSAEFVGGYHCVQEVSLTNATVLNQRHKTDRFVDYEDFIKSGNRKEGVKKDVPDTMDWRTSGIVSHVKDQLRCGSSYAFSAMGSLEGINALAYRTLATLSEQNIVDCSVAYGNHGCSCGEINSAFLYVIENDGVDTWWGYPSGGDPYRSRQHSCTYDVKYKGATARGVVTLPKGNENSLMSAVANSGPVSVYVDGTSTSFQFYYDGILSVPSCSTTTMSHSLVVIGYGTLDGQDYWLVKNSWGPNWGTRGFGKLSRNSNNQCGIATAPSFPIL